MDITVFDIETGINEKRFDRYSTPFTKDKPEVTPFDPASVKLGAMKDEEKIAAKIEASRLKHEETQKQAIRDWEKESLDHVQKQLDKAALYPGLSEIVAIGWQVKGCAPVALIVGDNVKDEKELVLAFLQFFHQTIEASRNGGRVCKFGFWSGNNKRDGFFDYLHIVEACRRHGINPGAEFLTSPGDYRGGRLLDLSTDFLSRGAILPKQDGYPAYLSLNAAVDYTDGFDKACDTLIAEKSGTAEWMTASKDALDVEGATFAEWVRTGEKDLIDKAREYLINDLALTRWVANQQVGLI